MMNLATLLVAIALLVRHSMLSSCVCLAAITRCWQKGQPRVSSEKSK